MIVLSVAILALSLSVRLLLTMLSPRRGVVRAWRASRAVRWRRVAGAHWSVSRLLGFDAGGIGRFVAFEQGLAWPEPGGLALEVGAGTALVLEALLGSFTPSMANILHQSGPVAGKSRGWHRRRWRCVVTEGADELGDGEVG